MDSLNDIINDEGVCRTAAATLGVVNILLLNNIDMYNYTAVNQLARGWCLFTDRVEEVPVKWMDRPSATEMDGGHASEMDRQKSAKNMETPLK